MVEEWIKKLRCFIDRVNSDRYGLAWLCLGTDIVRVFREVREAAKSCIIIKIESTDHRAEVTVTPGHIDEIIVERRGASYSEERRTTLGEALDEAIKRISESPALSNAARLLASALWIVVPMKRIITEMARVCRLLEETDQELEFSTRCGGREVKFDRYGDVCGVWSGVLNVVIMNSKIVTKLMIPLSNKIGINAIIDTETTNLKFLNTVTEAVNECRIEPDPEVLDLVTTPINCVLQSIRYVSRLLIATRYLP